jgi:hypothetical protein
MTWLLTRQSAGKTCFPQIDSGHLRNQMSTVWRKSLFAILLALRASGYLSQVRAGEARTQIQFTIERGQTQPFITQLVVNAQGRIVLDAASSPRTIEVTLLLRRPDGTVASRISGAGGNLSLTYFATQREVNESLSNGNLRWSVEISKPPNSEALRGRLKATHPVHSSLHPGVGCLTLSGVLCRIGKQCD